MPIYWFIRGAFTRIYRFCLWVSYPYEVTIENVKEDGVTETRTHVFHTRQEMVSFQSDRVFCK